MNAADSPINNATTLVMAQAFQRAGLTMDGPSMDWATLTQRRNRREPIEQGDYNLFVTVAKLLDGQNPLTNPYLASPCEGGLTGWPCDQQLEDLRRSWWEENDAAKRTEILHRVHARAYDARPYINAGQFRTLAAHRANIEGLRATTVPVFWAVTKR